MKWFIGALLLAVFCIALLSPVEAKSANANVCNGNVKVSICHIPPGNPGNAHTITISECAVAKHFENHGDNYDFLGSCEAPAQPITCEQAVGAGLLTGAVNGSTATARNLANQSFNVSLAAYQMYSNNTFDQTLADSEMKTLAPGTNASFDVTIPMCAYQIELICGSPITPPEYGPFTVIDWEWGNENLFCGFTNTSNQPGISATLSVVSPYPLGGDFNFLCTANNFTATQYHWYYGDGDFDFNSTQNMKFHTYAPGTYQAACTATNGSHTATATYVVDVPSPE